MSHKLLPRLGSAIASTILSYAALSLVGVDKAQAAVLTYNFQVGGGGSDLKDFFKVDTSSLTGIGLESIPVSEGRFYGYTVGGKEYHNLAGKSVLFSQGDFRGLYGSDGDDAIRELIIPPDEPGGPLYVKVDRRISWYIQPYGTSSTTWESLLDGYYEEYTTYDDNSPRLSNRNFFRDVPVSYTLVDTAPSPVPEPLTAGGTALALAGLSWLKHKKKMAA